MRIAGIMTESIVDGPGIRFVVFGQGCPHGCIGCHNPETWDAQAGQSITNRELIKQIRKQVSHIRGVTLSGGEPFLQAAEMADLARRIHVLGLDVVTYTGYLYENLLEMSQEDEGIRDLLEQTDILVDGPFIMDRKDISLRFRGSANQRVIDLAATRLKGEVVLLPEEALRGK